METPDIPDLEPFVAGVVRGKKWTPPPQEARMQAAEEQIAIDLGDEYEQALTDATQEEIIDLAAILGFHQMVMTVIYIECPVFHSRTFLADESRSISCIIIE